MSKGGRNNRPLPAGRVSRKKTPGEVREDLRIELLSIAENYAGLVSDRNDRTLREMHYRRALSSLRKLLDGRDAWLVKAAGPKGTKLRNGMRVWTTGLTDIHTTMDGETGEYISAIHYPLWWHREFREDSPRPGKDFVDWFTTSPYYLTAEDEVDENAPEPADGGLDARSLAGLWKTTPHQVLRFLANQCDGSHLKNERYLVAESMEKQRVNFDGDVENGEGGLTGRHLFVAELCRLSLWLGSPIVGAGKQTRWSRPIRYRSIHGVFRTCRNMNESEDEYLTRASQSAARARVAIPYWWR